VLLRCVLDTWDTAYYMLPFIFALLAWEVSGAPQRPPVLAVAVTALAWISFEWLPGHVSADIQSAFFLAWSLPLCAALAWLLYAPARTSLSPRPRIAWRIRGTETTVSALDRLVSTSGPVLVTTTRSSIRTPRRPGK
jgi:hypothetical protein